MSEPTITGPGVERIAELAKNAAGYQVIEVNTAGIVGLPEDFPVLFDKRQNGNGLVDLRAYAEKWREAPERCKGTATVTTLQSFIDLTNRHKDEESAVFTKTTWPEPSLTAVLNYYDADSEIRYADHRVRYAFPITDEFKAWAAADGKGMSQMDFAVFVEDRAPELATPTDAEQKEFEDLFLTKFATPSDMIVLSRGLQVNVAGTVKQNTNLSSGEGEIVFVEEHQNGKGEKLTVPGLFMIALPVFIDGKPVRIPTRLRYRVREGSVTWFFQMFRWKELVRDRVVDDAKIAATGTVLPMFEGSPEA